MIENFQMPVFVQGHVFVSQSVILNNSPVVANTRLRGLSEFRNLTYD